jgi:hypothetical protein
MKRMAIIVSITSVSVLILGLVEALTNFRWSAGDQNPLTGNPKLLLNDGQVALILGGCLTLASLLMWILVFVQMQRKGQGDQRQS